MMWWWNDYGPEPWMYYMPVFFILMMAVCVGMMFYVMRGHHSGHSGLAHQILKERFARGEIDKAEYDERRRTLGA
jgi:putative membrane protein